MKQESIIKKVLDHEIFTIVKLVGFIAAIISFFYCIKMDIALIQKDISVIRTNELRHIQDNIQREEERNNKQDLQLDSIDKNITRVITILEEDRNEKTH